MHNIRSLTAEDLTQVDQIAKQVSAYPWDLQVFASCMQPDYYNLVLEVDGELIGYLVSKIELSECWIMQIGIASGKQRQGWGSYLLQALLREPYTAFGLEVRASNQAALALYRSFGFVEIARRKGYYPTPHGREDAIVMQVESPIKTINSK